MPEAGAPGAREVLARLAPLFAVQFLCWGAMFLMWIAAYPVIVLGVLALPPGAMASRTGLLVLSGCFAWYAALAAGLAFALPWLTARARPPVVLGLCCLVGAAGLAGIGLAREAGWLVPCFTLLAVGWAALSNLPYAMAGRLVPEAELDHWFRVFAFSSILPQLAVAVGLVLWLGELDAGFARRVMLLAAAAMAGGGVLALALRERLWP